MKTYIISCHCNMPEYIKLQYKSIQKYFKSDYEYIVINDAKDYGDLTNFEQYDVKNKIISICEQFGITYHNVPQDLHTNRTKIFPNTIEPSSQNAASRATIAYQYGLNLYRSSGEYIFMLDADMFFINDFNITDFINNYNLCGIKQGIGYLWTGITIFNTKELNLNDYICDCGRVNDIPVDAGGQSYHFMEKYKDIIKYKPITCSHYTFPDTYKQLDNDLKILLSKYSELREDTSANKEIILNNSIFHLRSGSNWDYRTKEFKYKELSIIENYLIN